MARVQPVFMAKGNGGFADGIQTNVSHLIEVVTLVMLNNGILGQ